MRTDMHKTMVRVAAYLMPLVGMGALFVACETPEFSNAPGAPKACEEDCDCYRGENYELGTRCMDGQCVCPVEGHYRVPCCLKGAPADDCQRQCRRVEECAEFEVIDPPETAGGASGMPSVPAGVPCSSAAECPGPEDAACGSATCVDGVCRLEIKAGPVASQKRGDCVTVYCDPLGKLVTLDDPSDVYNDGSQCSFDVCDKGAPAKLSPNGVVCPETGIGVCFEGACVACIDVSPWETGCPMGFACDGSRCVPAHCVNSTWDFGDGETAPDCGGPCTPCSAGLWCSKPSDCIHGVCLSGICAPPTCSDQVKNDSETDVDCGGTPSCKRCSPGQACELGDDCSSGVCWAGVCEAPRCDDGVKNGIEEDIDCGGECAACL